MESAGSLKGEPWGTFASSRQALAAGRTAEAIEGWQRIIAMRDLESRHYLQAWHFLGERGVKPPQESVKVLLGVVVEVPMEGGLDLLAAYADHHARYFNFSGAAVIWEHPNDSLDPTIDALLAAGTQILKAIGPWNKPRPAAPPPGQVRLNLLSPAGLHFGQAPMQVLTANALAKPTIDAAVALMQGLFALGKRPAS
jgi:hypothetical protein